MRPPGGWGKLGVKAANEVITDPEAAEAKAAKEVITHPEAAEAKAAKEAITDIEQRKVPLAVSACVPYREYIAGELKEGRNANAQKPPTPQQSFPAFSSFQFELRSNPVSTTAIGRF